MNTLQERQQWNIKRCNFQVNDIVLIKTDASRNQWPMARIVKVLPDDLGIVRCVELTVGRKANTDKQTLERPMQKLVLLSEANDDMMIDSPTREP